MGEIQETLSMNIKILKASFSSCHELFVNIEIYFCFWYGFYDGLPFDILTRHSFLRILVLESRIKSIFYLKQEQIECVVQMVWVRFKKLCKSTRKYWTLGLDLGQYTIEQRKCFSWYFSRQPSKKIYFLGTNKWLLWEIQTVGEMANCPPLDVSCWLFPIHFLVSRTDGGRLLHKSVSLLPPWSVAAT